MSMESPAQPIQNSPKKTNPALWIILAIVVIIAVAAFIYYWQTTNTNTNANVANTNTRANINTNAKENTNTVMNINSSTNTSGWFEYTNTKYGYSIKVPSDWKAASELDGSAIQLKDISPDKSYISFESFNSKIKGGFVISFDENTNKTNLEDYAKSSVQFYSLNKSFQKSYIRNANNVEGIKYVVSGAQSYLGATINAINYYFWNRSLPLYIGFTEDNDLYTAIVNSLKLNNGVSNTNVDTTGWKTYGGGKYYSLMYPNQWYFQEGFLPESSNIEYKLLANEYFGSSQPPYDGITEPAPGYLININILKNSATTLNDYITYEKVRSKINITTEETMYVDGTEGLYLKGKMGTDNVLKFYLATKDIIIVANSIPYTGGALSSEDLFKALIKTLKIK